jgi:twitching motility protein PilT
MTIRDMIAEARRQNASDLHFVSGRPLVMRIDGDMREMPSEYMLTDFDGELLALLPEGMRESFAAGEDADFAYQTGETDRCRVNLFHQMGKIGCVMRLLSDHIPTMEELCLPDVMKKLAMLPRGLVLVTGPTGSGKSTTLASMVDYANHHRKDHIITIEDPIEYVQKAAGCLVDQREVGRDVISFSAALRSALREDPDIILVGEMRDLETISSALTAAETGHLVFSTLHTTGAAKTIDRIIDVFEPHQQEQIRVQLAGVLKAVITQTLVRKTDGGRRAAFEIMLVTDSVANMIRENKTHQINSSIQTGRQEGMVLLDASLGDLVRRGEITMEEALSHCADPSELKRFC